MIGLQMVNAVDTPNDDSGETKKRRTRSRASSQAIIGDGAVNKPRSQVMREYFDRRQKAGEKRVTVWLSKRAREALARLKERHGSYDAAVEHAVLHCEELVHESENS